MLIWCLSQLSNDQCLQAHPGSLSGATLSFLAPPAFVWLGTYWHNRPSYSSYWKRPWGSPRVLSFHLLIHYSTHRKLCLPVQPSQVHFAFLGSRSSWSLLLDHSLCLDRLIPALYTEKAVTQGHIDMKCSGQRGSDQLADRRAKGLVPSNMSEDSICCFFLEHVLGTQTSCKRSSGLQEKDFTEQKRAKAGSPCQQQHAGETTRKADAGNPERSISKRCSSYTASSLRHGYLATSLCSGEVLL